MIEKIISGGQTGADQAALDAAIKLGIESEELTKFKDEKALIIKSYFHTKSIQEISPDYIVSRRPE